VTVEKLIACTVAVVLYAGGAGPGFAQPGLLLSQADASKGGAPQVAQQEGADKPTEPAYPGTGSTTPETGSVQPAGGVPSTTAPQAKKPVKLFGRIEELCSTPGARLPIKLQALTPKLDNSRPLKAEARTSGLSGRATSAYPVEWAGVWSGTLKVWTSQFDPSLWKFDAAEASQEQDLLKPGTEGQASFNFSMDANRQIQLEPTQVVFTAPMDAAKSQRMMSQMQQMMGGMQGQLMQGPGRNFMMQMMQSVPYMYAMHLGNLEQGTGVTGNLLASRLMKNDVKVLAANTLEQQIVTYDEDVNRQTGKKRTSYTETVLRFTRINREQLYVQAASVDYDRYGKFEQKVVMYGTINRGQASSPLMPNMPNMMNGGSLQNLFNGGGGLQNLFPFGQ
jgi:hypothetical protein